MSCIRQLFRINCINKPISKYYIEHVGLFRINAGKNGQHSFRSRNRLRNAEEGGSLL
jgi:hypothetical protein